MQSKSNYGEDEIPKSTVVHPQNQARRKGVGKRVWLLLPETGRVHLEDLGKHSIMKRTGLPARDLRALDPALSYPSSILGRERAIMMNLEHIKAIITATEVLMVNSTNPLVVEFVEDLKNRISSSNTTSPQKDKENSGADMDNDPEGVWSPNHDAAAAQSLCSKSKDDKPLGTGPKQLPFEFRALEAGLESACKCLETETDTLEKEAYTALDELTSRISTLNLERVRQIKSRLVAISGRVQKVRDELEHLLDDDNDMVEMYLTEKLNVQSVDSNNTSMRLETCDEEERAEESLSARESSFCSAKPNTQELEMLLDAYFVQVDGILQKLTTMNEYVNDTEDYINIMLDDKQNQLLQMGVLLSTAILFISAGVAVAGVFGMNIHISLFEKGQPPMKFWATTIGTLGGCLVLYALAITWGKKKFQI